MYTAIKLFSVAKMKVMQYIFDRVFAYISAVEVLDAADAVEVL